MYACGTLRINRVGTPKAIQAKRKPKIGECIFRTSRTMKFKDKQDVNILGMIHEPKRTVLWKKKFQTGQHITKPTCIVDFCKFMGSVDLLDWYAQYNTIARKTN